MRVVSEEKREGRDFGRTMGNGVMSEFGGGEERGPLMGVIGTKDSKICFNFLISSFGLSIGLRVVGGRESNVVFEDSSKFLGERRSKLRSSVRDKSIVKSKAFEHMVKKELGNTVRVDSLGTRG